MLVRKIMIGLVLLMAFLAVGCASQNNSAKSNLPRVPWLRYHPAMATGKEESKPILLHFTTEWNKGSQSMELETYGNFEVAEYLGENFAAGWIDTEQYPGLAKKYNVNGLPTIWFLDSEGKTLTSVDGYLGPERMLLILEFIKTRAYDEMSYEAWKDQRSRR